MQVELPGYMLINHVEVYMAALNGRRYAGKRVEFSMSGNFEDAMELTSCATFDQCGVEQVSGTRFDAKVRCVCVYIYIYVYCYV